MRARTPGAQTVTIRRTRPAWGIAGKPLACETSWCRLLTRLRAPRTQNGPSANGTVVTSLSTSFDARSGMVLGMTDKNYSTPSYNVVGSLAYAHDTAGRQTTLTENYTLNGSQTAYATRAYDAENHVISQTYTRASFECADSLSMCGNQQSGNNAGVSPGFATTYGWGPDGHPITFGFQNGYQTVPFSVHWDGDDVLLAVGNGTGIDVEIGKLGTTNESSYWGMTITDRDMTGAQVASHTGTAFSAWSSAAPTKSYHVPCSKCQNEQGYVAGAISSGDSEYAPATQYLSAGRTDGYADGYGNTFQGVRAYDENTAQRTAPDAYAGDVHDPTSQKPFMWNNNNPLAYSDPSGYVSYVGVNSGSDGTGGGMGHEMVIVQDPGDPNRGMMYSWRPDDKVPSGQKTCRTCRRDRHNYR